MERLTERLYDGYIRIVGCKTVYGGKERKPSHMTNAIIRLATYEDTMSLERAQELAQAEKEGRLVVLQDGVTVRDLQNEYCKTKHMADEQLPSPSYATGLIAGFGDGAMHILDKILTREEAEAALKKREADNEIN